MKILTPNTLLQNRYLIIQLIGKGGMGEVYLAIDQRLGSSVALKRTLYADEQNLNRAFEREAKILARLRHPALPKVSDHFTEDDIQYLVMDHISGDDLSKRLDINDKPFSLNWVSFWADQLLDALAYLHSHKPAIIHRDIKPHNLKLTNENHIVLLDFGLVKNTIGETRLSSTGSLSGFTPNYASMEQIRGTGTIAQSDIYSLSVTLYQLLTNVIPPDALSRADSFLSGNNDPVIPINILNPEIPPEISNVILKGMNLSIESRYQSAREMQAALRDVQSTIPVSSQSMQFNVAEITPIQNISQPNELEHSFALNFDDNNAVTSYSIQSNNDFISPPHNPDITVQLVHFKEVSEIKQENLSEPNSTTEFISASDKVSTNHKSISEKILPVKNVAKSQKFPIIAVIAGCSAIGIILAIIVLFALSPINSATDSKIVSEPTTAPVEPTPAPSNQIIVESNKLSNDSAAYSSDNSNVSIANNNQNDNLPLPTPDKTINPTGIKAANPKSKPINEPTPSEPTPTKPPNTKPNLPKIKVVRDPGKVF